MKKYILSLCVGLVIILPTISLAQGWVERYNNPGNSGDQARAQDRLASILAMAHLTIFDTS